jgi:hypothetical protein
LGETGLDSRVKKAIDLKTNFSSVLTDSVTLEEIVAHLS